MSKNNIEQIKKILEEKNKKAKFLQEEKKIGSGSVEKMNKNINTGSTRTKKIY